MNITIIGAGLAGVNAAEELRAHGYTEEITLLGDERHTPYERPPLSKGVLLGDEAPESVFVHEAKWYAEHQVDLRVGETVTGIDRDGGRVSLGAGEVAYDRLIVATGAEPRRLPMFDTGREDVMVLRTLEDSERLKARLAGTVLIIGAGWIGLEVASAAVNAGAEVTVVETAELPLLGVMGSEIAEVFADLHREHGVDLRLDTGVTAVEGSGDRLHVELTDGHRISPDLVVVAVGVRPRDDLAARAGFAVDNGILVNPWLRTEADTVFAIGDVANQDHPRLGRRVRVEHWDNAINQGKHVARVILGSDDPYDQLPYFFTDQYDLGMEYVGHTGDGYDRVITRGDLAGRNFTALWVKDDRVAAGMHVNDWDAIDHLRRVVGGEATPDVLDPSVPLDSLGGATD